MLKDDFSRQQMSKFFLDFPRKTALHFVWTFSSKTNYMTDFLILKVPGKQAADDIQKYFLYYFSREKVWHFMWNICLPAANVRDLYHIKSLIFSKK